MGQSEAFLEFQEQLSRVAGVDRPVMLIGERGTGKELAALRLHYLSKRWQQPLVALNCAALAPSLIESELFGHDAGAFTGAVQRKIGRFESADGGTLFLDEIGTIPLEVQEKILRVVEYRRFERVGASTSIDIDVRIIGATNADLPALIRKGRFKKDLLDRLAFEVLFLPPLRHRQGDIRLLAEHFARRMAIEIGLPDPPVFSRDAMARLEEHPWEGNVRELKNVVERAVYRSETAEIDHIDFDPFHSPYPDSGAAEVEVPQRPSSPRIPAQISRLPLKNALKQLEIQMLRDALATTRYNQTKAARRLGLSYDQFRARYRKYRHALIIDV